MNLLLDTHMLLWWITDDEKLSKKMRQCLQDPENKLFVSAVTAWELAIKSRLGRISFPKALADFLPEQLQLNRMKELSVTLRHALQVESLPTHHNDPFDRMLVAQAQVERLSIVSADKLLSKYDVPLVR